MKICFVGQITNSLQDRIIGGAGRQVQLIAEHMAKRGHEVTCVISDVCHQNHMNEIRLISGWDPNYGIPGLRWLTYRIPNLRTILLNIKADVYYTRGFSIYAPTVVSVAKRMGAISIINLASDTDLLLRRQKIFSEKDNWRGKLSNNIFFSYYFRFFGLKKASFVICQSHEQKNMCDKLNIKSKIIPNIFEEEHIEPIAVIVKPKILWIGSLSPWKGITELSALINVLNDIEFEIIGRLTDLNLRPLLNSMRLRNNVKWMSELKHNLVMIAISEAAVLINTSPREGFSNVMIEAWSLGKPVVSLYANPNNLLKGNDRLGDCADGDIQKMAEQIRFWIHDSKEKRALENRARVYVRDNHAPDTICSEFETLFDYKRPKGLYNA